MPVVAYVARDPAGNPWPPVHEHEAAAAIGMIQRLHESLNHERSLYVVLANLQAPSADLVVLTELGLGVVELKHYSGALSVQAGAPCTVHHRTIERSAMNASCRHGNRPGRRGLVGAALAG